MLMYIIVTVPVLLFFVYYEELVIKYCELTKGNINVKSIRKEENES